MSNDYIEAIGIVRSCATKKTGFKNMFHTSVDPRVWTLDRMASYMEENNQPRLF